MNLSRLAPSPTGALHLGNARTFLINWLLAKQRGWRILLRIEDLDGPRIKKGADQQAIEDLCWLGLDWDEGPVYQSSRMAIYREAVEQLLKMGLAYPCVCSRREVELAASAPHAEDGSSAYPGTCRGKFASVEEAIAKTGKKPAIRFLSSPSPLAGEGRGEGETAEGQLRESAKRRCELTPHPSPLPQGEREQMQTQNDFVIAKADGTPAYQLAVVVDDAAAGVTHVVRGDDLLESTPRQMMLYRALGMEDRIPQYIHLPLVIGEDGRRLAKRHGDTRLSYYRDRGVMPERLVALLARWSGVEAGDAITARQLIDRFDLSRVPKPPIVFTACDDAWLIG